MWLQMWAMKKKVMKQVVKCDEFGRWWTPGYRAKRRYESTT